MQALRDFAATGAFGGTFGLLAFGAFFLAFAIKVPMFPFHTWLPDAHIEAPTAGSVILAGVLLKLGGYGFIRFALPLFPDAAQTLAPVIIVLSLIAIIYGAIVALVQPDLKKLVAYSSVSHMGFVTLGIFVFQEQGIQGAILQMINHGLITGALFLLVGVIYERTHDRTIAKMGGLGRRTPVYAAVFGFFVFASVGLPGLSGFVGEFLTLVGTFVVNPAAAAVVATFVMVLAAAYLLCMFRRVVFGELSDFLKGLGNHLTDMRPIEILTLVPLGALVVVFGLSPGPAPRPRPGLGGRRSGGSRPHRSPSDCGGRSGSVTARIATCSRRSSAPSSSPSRSSWSTSSGPASRSRPCSRPSWAWASPRARIGGQRPRPGGQPRGVRRGLRRRRADDVPRPPVHLDRRAHGRVRAGLPEAADLPVAEFAAILVFAMSGAMLIAGSADLLVLFLGLELMVLPGYMLAGYHKNDGLLHRGRDQVLPPRVVLERHLPVRPRVRVGHHGHHERHEVAGCWAGRRAGALGALAGPRHGPRPHDTGVAFKIAAVPFHYWTPDAYQGSPTPVTGWLSVGPKVGAFALIIRLFGEALGRCPTSGSW